VQRKSEIRTQGTENRIQKKGDRRKTRRKVKGQRIKEKGEEQ
jgi:hypothetical protein